jgi:hypothetical protein
MWRRSLERLARLSPLRATVVSAVASLVRGRLAAGFAVRNLARLGGGRPVVRLALRHSTTRLILSSLA